MLLAAVITGVFIMLEAVRADAGFGKFTVLLLAAMIGIAGLALISAFTTNGRMFMGLIYILIACTFLNQAFFAIHLGFFSLFIYRLLLIGAGALHIAGILTNRHHIDRWNRVNVKGVLMFFALWFTYGLISLLWAKSVTYGIKYLALMAMGMFLIYLVVMFIQRLDQLMVFYGIWLVMTIFVMAIGFTIILHITICRAPRFITGRSTNSIIRRPFSLIKMISRRFYASVSFCTRRR